MSADGIVELIDKDKGKTFLVNIQRVKYYWGKEEDRKRMSVELSDE